MYRLGADINVPSMGFDEAEQVALDFGNYSVVFALQAKNASILMFTELAELKAEEVNDWAVKLLAANLFGIGTGGANLALEQNSGGVLFSYVIPLQENYENMYAQVEHFLHFSEYWRSLLTGSENLPNLPEPENANAQSFAQFLRV